MLLLGYGSLTAVALLEGLVQLLNIGLVGRT
jgi:hypothetical protein